MSVRGVQDRQDWLNHAARPWLQAAKWAVKDSNLRATVCHLVAELRPGPGSGGARAWIASLGRVKARTFPMRPFGHSK